MRKIFLFLWIYCCALSRSFALDGLVVEVNEATEKQLVQLKGVGSKTAQLIIQERQRAGAFRSVQEFSARIKGMGKKKIEKLLQQGMRVNGQATFTVPSVEKSSRSATVDAYVSSSKKEETAEGKIMYVRPKQLSH